MMTKNENLTSTFNKPVFKGK